jgi:predicted DNA-binding transcriptional regulator AlpA
MKPDISHFDQLPNSAMVTVKTFSAVLDAGDSTVWRRAKNEPTFPQPIRLGSKCTRFNVGAIRAFIAGSALQ